MGKKIEMSHKQIKVIVLFIVSSMVSWVFSGSLATAQSGGGRFDFYPEYYRVHNVASNDVLNIRADSDSGAPIVGSFSPHAQPIEVLRREHNWGYVATGEQMGWVSMNFLTQIDLPKVGQSQLPVGLSCGGNEPFWGFRLGQSRVDFSFMGENDVSFKIDTAGGFAGYAGNNGFVQAGGTLSLFTAIFNANQCSDGMSDLDYGWQVDVVWNGEQGTQGYSGCCRMAVSP